MSVRVTFEIGHEATLKAKPTPEGFTHEWQIYVKGYDNSNINHFVEKVVFNLHESFPKPKRVIKEPPYLLKQSGYAGFIIPIDIYLKNREEPKKISFNYDLVLQATTPCIRSQREIFTIPSPSDDFRRKLLKGGGIIISNAGTNLDDKHKDINDERSQLISKPKLGGSGGIVDSSSGSVGGKKHKHRPDDTKVSNTFANLFGTPITKTSNKVSPEIKNSSKLSPNMNTLLNKQQSISSSKVQDKTSSKDKNEEKSKEKSSSRHGKNSSPYKEKDLRKNSSLSDTLNEKTSRDGSVSSMGKGSSSGKKEKSHSKERERSREKNASKKSITTTTSSPKRGSLLQSASPNRNSNIQSSSNLLANQIDTNDVKTFVGNNNSNNSNIIKNSNSTKNIEQNSKKKKDKKEKNHDKEHRDRDKRDKDKNKEIHHSNNTNSGSNNTNKFSLDKFELKSSSLSNSKDKEYNNAKDNVVKHSSNSSNNIPPVSVNTSNVTNDQVATKYDNSSNVKNSNNISNENDRKHKHHKKKDKNKKDAESSHKEKDKKKDRSAEKSHTNINKTDYSKKEPSKHQESIPTNVSTIAPPNPSVLNSKSNANPLSTLMNEISEKETTDESDIDGHQSPLQQTTNLNQIPLNSNLTLTNNPNEIMSESNSNSTSSSIHLNDIKAPNPKQIKQKDKNKDSKNEDGSIAKKSSRKRKLSSNLMEPPNTTNPSQSNLSTNKNLKRSSDNDININNISPIPPLPSLATSTSTGSITNNNNSKLNIENTSTNNHNINSKNPRLIQDDELIGTNDIRNTLPLDFTELKDLQNKIMSLQDNNGLQQVVEIIAATGRFEITSKTFDFDLCTLDRDTVLRLQDFFQSLS